MKTTKYSAIGVLALSLALTVCAAPPALAQHMQPAMQTMGISTTRTFATQTSSDQAAIRAVIQKANQEQQQAFAQQDPALVQDTATASYAQQLAQTNSDLAANGVTAIKLAKLQWGPISVSNGNSAQATTFETWSTSFSDGSVAQQRDQNVYTLVQQNGQWKIQSDDHPGSALDQPAPNPAGNPAGSPQPATPIPSGSTSSHNWSGYSASGGAFTAVNGTWTVPQVDASGGSLGAGATWVGVGGVTTRDLIQAGTDETADGSGAVHYEAWIETLPQASHPIPLAVHPGDSISVSLADQSGPTWSVAVKDNTTGQQYHDTVTYDSSQSSAEWVEEAPSAGRGVLPLDNFGSVHFTGASAVENGKTVNVAQAGAQPITMIGALGQPLAVPSALNGDGSSFTVSRTQATATSPARTPRGFVRVPGIGLGVLPFVRQPVGAIPFPGF